MTQQIPQFLGKNDRETISRIKSRFNQLVEVCRSKKQSVYVANVDQLILERKETKCNHHMESCIRTQDSVLELLYYFKAINSNFSSDENKTITVNLLF